MEGAEEEKGRSGRWGGGGCGGGQRQCLYLREPVDV